MGATTIEWTEQTWNPVVGCSVVSPGCTNCYAMKMAARCVAMGLKQYEGLTKPSKAGAVWTGKLTLVEDALTAPLRRRKPTVYFVNSMSDLFHEGVPDAWIDRVFAVMALAPQHTFQVLTKRSARMRAYLSSDETAGRMTRLLAHGLDGIGSLTVKTDQDGLRGFKLPNVWLGVSAEDQQRADERVPDLLATPATVRFVSAEPLLGPLSLSWAMSHPLGIAAGFLQRGQFSPGMETLRRLDWIIVGGESGPKARPMHPAWARSIRDQCAAAGVAFHFKQWGAWGPTHPEWPRAEPTVMADDGTLYRPADIAYPDGPRYGEAVRANHQRAHLTSIYRVGKKAAGRLLNGVEHNGFPSPSRDGGER